MLIYFISMDRISRSMKLDAELEEYCHIVDK
jgi:hypothetical protein